MPGATASKPGPEGVKDPVTCHCGQNLPGQWQPRVPEGFSQDWYPGAREQGKGLAGNSSHHVRKHSQQLKVATFRCPIHCCQVQDFTKHSTKVASYQIDKNENEYINTQGG